MSSNKSLSLLIIKASKKCQMGWIKKAAFSSCVKAIFFNITQSLIPIGATVMAPTLGYITDIPFFWIWLGILASLALTFHWLLIINKWSFEQKAQDKVVFDRINVFYNIKGNGVGLGINFSSKANFPIEYEIIEFRTKLGDKVPSDDFKPIKSYICATGYAWYNSHPIKVDSIKSKVITGIIEYNINYGKNGHLKYNFSGKKTSKRKIQ